MTRTQLLQEIRRMRLVEAYVGWQVRRLTRGDAPRRRQAQYPLLETPSTRHIVATR